MINFLEEIAKKYLNLYAYIEGPELEANILHSHYFAARALRSFENSIIPKLDGHILDVGAGTGYGKILLNPNAKYSPTDIDTARDYTDISLTENGIPLVKNCSVYKIDFGENNFDGCLALNLFEHLKHPNKAIKEITRVVKNDGIFILLVPFCFPVHGHPDDYWRWTEEGVRAFLEKNKITILRIMIHGKTIHSIILNINLFLRYGIFMSGHEVSIFKSILHVILRPFLTILFLIFNLIGLLAGFFDKSATCPILVSCVGRINK